MGAHQSSRPHGTDDTSKGLVAKPEIAPFRDGISTPNESFLQRYLRSEATEYHTAEEKEDTKYIQTQVEKAERVIPPDELTRIRKDFDKFSKENKMAKRKLLDYYGLSELNKTQFGTNFFNSIKKRGTNQKASYLDYAKFIRANSTLTKGDENARIEFIYSIFDPQGNGYVERDDMIRVFTQFLDAMKTVTFDSDDLIVLQNKVNSPSLYLWNS